MKKITRILSVALVAMMVLSLSSFAAADDTSVYIPTKLSKLGLDVSLDDIAYPELSIKISNLAKTYYYDERGKKQYYKYDDEYCPVPEGDANGNPVGYTQKSITEDSVAKYQFSEKPDWFGVVLSPLDGGWANIDIDDSGYGEFEVGELHVQPGMWVWNGSGWNFDDDGNRTDKWYGHSVGGDYPYSGGKDYGDYNVKVSYYRSGEAYKLEVTLKNAPDPFLTGMDGAVVTVVYESVAMNTNCYADAVFAWEDSGHKDANGFYVPKPQPGYAWYMSHVEAVYPEGNYIIGVGTDWRNDKKQNLASYRIAYAVSETQIYVITYAPKTTTIYENRNETASFIDHRGTEWDLKSDPTGAWARHSTEAEDLRTTEKFLDLGRINSSLGAKPSQVVPVIGQAVDEETGEPKVDEDGNPVMEVKGFDYMHHYTADEAIYGLFYKSRADFEDGNAYAVSGSGNNLSKWYQWNGSEKKNGIVHNNNGKRVKSIKKSCTSFKSPRRTTK